MQKPEPLGASSGTRRDAGDVAARPVEARDKPKLTGSAAVNTIGIVVVAALAASAAAGPVATISRPAANQVGRQPGNWS